MQDSNVALNLQCKQCAITHESNSIGIIWSLVLTPRSQADSDFLSAELWDLGAFGFEEKDGALCAYFPDEVPHHSIAASFPDHAFETTHQIETTSGPDTLHAEPILAATRFVIAPAEAKGLPPGRIHLPIAAGMAFGSGRHETTQLCLRALELYVQPHHTVFDIGCGSAILSLAAAKLGASIVIATDFDYDSLCVARRHFQGPLFAGSADCFSSAGAHLVVSNITGPVNDRIAPDLHRIAKPDGWLIISGFTTDTAPRHFHPERILLDGDWQCWVCRPDPRPAIDLQPSTSSDHVKDWWL